MSKPPSPCADYIYRNSDALRVGNPCYWPGYDPVESWKYIAHLIGYGLREFDAADVKREMGSLYGIVPMCCILARKPVPIDAKQFLRWVNERYKGR